MRLSVRLTGLALLAALAPTAARALAVRDGKIAAVGTSAEIRALAGPATRVIALGGRTVIPGLIDSHMHAIRAALFYATEVNWIGTHGEAAARRTPPIKTAMNIGLHIGGGTDAHRVMSYDPMVSLQWMIDGRTVAGTPTRDADARPSREEALRLYTQGSAWFTFDDDKRGAFEAGRLADLAVLSKDVMTVPADEIGGIESSVTMVGGRIVHAAEPFLASKQKYP